MKDEVWIFYVEIVNATTETTSLYRLKIFYYNFSNFRLYKGLQSHSNGILLSNDNAEWDILKYQLIKLLETADDR